MTPNNFPVPKTADGSPRGGRLFFLPDAFLQKSVTCLETLVTADQIAALAVKLLEADERTEAARTAQVGEWERAQAWAQAVIDFDAMKEALLAAARKYRDEQP